MIFKNRIDAGKKLGVKLKQYTGQAETIVLGLPRGGVITAYEVAKDLGLPLDIIVPRKIGAPMEPELAIGAIAEDGKAIIDYELVGMLNISQDYINKAIEKEKQEAQRRLQQYRGARQSLDLKNKITILVDDGVATGSTMRAAIASAKVKGAKKIIVAAPVIAPDTLSKLEAEADEVIYLDAPAFFGAVGAFYKKFDQTQDEDVVQILKKAR